MKKSATFLFIFLLIFGITLCASAADTVYLDGTGETDGAYTDLASAFAALENGGTLVVTGDTTFGATNEGVTLPAVGGKVTVTGENGAVLTMVRSLTLSSEVAFENINFCSAHSSNGNIIANGNALTFGEGVTVTASSDRYPTLIGGASSGTLMGGSHITVKSGTFRAVYGGNYAGTFNGDSEVYILGGTVKYAVSGGNLNGNFTGNATVNIGGTAAIEYDSNNVALIGGTVGSSSSTATAYTFNGDIAINIYGNATVASNIYAVSRYSNITTNGDVAVTVYENAKLSRQLYAGGYYGNITTGKNGIRVIFKDNATVTGSRYVTAGAFSGTVTGDCTVEFHDNASLVGAVYAGGYDGNVVGNSTAVLYGGKVTSTFASTSRGGSVSGSATTLLKGGTLGGEVKGDTEVDLSSGGTLILGTSVTAIKIVGGGTLTVPAAASITTDTLDGELTLVIDGTPVANQTYITVNDLSSDGSVAYTPAADETLTKSVGDTVTYTITYADRYDTTHVKVYYYNPAGEDETQPKLVMVKGLPSDSNRVSVTLTTGSEDGKNFAEADVDAGLYYYKVYYGSGGSDYAIKYFYVSGKAESLTFDAPFEPYEENSYTEQYTATMTDEVLENFFGTSDLVGYSAFDTPTFTNHASDRAFMNNAELCAYVDALDEKCDYLYVFYPFANSAMGNRTPVLVFTNDEIADGATFDEVAKTVRDGGEREILMISGGVHGNEPAGPEGNLAYAKELCGDYGKEVMDSFGAIVIIPSVSTDNFQRFTRTTADGINPNRDLVALELTSTQNQVYVYNAFMPTVYIDCHEDSGGVTVDTSDYSITSKDNSLSGVADVFFRYSGLQNSPLHDVAAFANGEDLPLEQTGNKIMIDAIERAEKLGLRAGVYYSATASPTHSSDYPASRGSYSFIIEVTRIWTGKSRYERAVYSMKEGLKALTNEIVEADGALAKDVYENRARVAGTTKFDENNLFATKTTKSGATTVATNIPSIYVDGTYKDKDATVSIRIFDTVSGLRALPTAYVIPADEADIDGILKLLDMHAISYTKIRAGSALTLRKYEGLDTAATTSAAVTMSDAEKVTFENGAYVVTLDTSDAYLIAYLFEPDSYPYSGADTLVSLTHMGYFEDGDALYRSETDDMTALIADMTYVEGDMDGDGDVDITDVIIVVKALLNGTENYTLRDVLRVLKLAVK